MRWLLAVALLSFFAFSAPQVGSAGNLTQHSYIFVNGYMDDTSVYQTDSGYAGQKLVAGTRGSGTVSRRQTAMVYSDENYEELSFNEWGVFDYKPFTPDATESDLKNALCAKNYAVGSVFSESYSDIQQLVKDTNIYQNDNVSVYQASSYVHGTAKIGARYREAPGSVAIMTMGGVYVGEAKIQEEIQVGDDSPLVLPCP